MESEEDEESIIEKRRQQRQAIVQKYQTPASVGSQSLQSSNNNSESESSDTVEQRATQDFENDISLAVSQTADGLKTFKTMAKPSKDGGTPVTEKESKTANGADTGTAGDMFAENYHVSSTHFMSVIVFVFRIPCCVGYFVKSHTAKTMYIEF